MASGWNIWMWLKCIGMLFCSIIFTSLFILKMFFRSLRRRRKKKTAKSRFVTSRGACVNNAIIIHSFDWKSAVEQDVGV